jgi:hypothetical protein
VLVVVRLTYLTECGGGSGEVACICPRGGTGECRGPSVRGPCWRRVVFRSTELPSRSPMHQHDISVNRHRAYLGAGLSGNHLGSLDVLRATDRSDPRIYLFFRPPLHSFWLVATASGTTSTGSSIAAAHPLHTHAVWLGVGRCAPMHNLLMAGLGNNPVQVFRT